MSAYESREELAAKIAWEGGIDEFLLGYGLSLSDLPAGDDELRDAVNDVLDLITPYEIARDALEELLPETEW